jgi:UDP-GlcNAc:undecaprenyl-phosphate GlcNAc-1-phosphate transferase
MPNLFSPLSISILVSLILGYPAMLLAKRLNIIDVPASAPHKTHTHPTPLAGGILMVFTFTLVTFLFRQWLSREIITVLAGALIIFIFGLWDDIKGLSAGPKLLGQFIAAVLLIASGVQVYFATILVSAGYISPTFAQVLNIAITLFWLIGITNALNMVDSMDGIVAGLGIIASICFMGATQLAGQFTLAFWLAILLGISFGLYVWNNLAGKFFLGDSGAQTIGFLLASLVCYITLSTATPNPHGSSRSCYWAFLFSIQLWLYCRGLEEVSLLAAADVIILITVSLPLACHRAMQFWSFTW